MSNKRGGDMEKARGAKVGDRDSVTPKQRAFVREYLVDRNGTQAARRAGYSPNSANEQASELLAKPNIKELVLEKERVLAAAAEVDAIRVIAELATIAFADSRELMSIHKDACRWCWGINGLRQWTRGEYAEALGAATRDGKPAPDVAGGLGFDPRREPNPSCAECAGRGVSTVILTDSRKLSRSASRLMASVKQNAKDGSIELKTHSQQDALMALARITGALKDKTEISGPGGGPIELQARPDPRSLSDEELAEALKLNGYRVIEGKQLGQGENYES